MAGQKKFGFFGGVFTPSILTILGVIMYMRLGWVVGHAGLTGSIIIILIAHVISIATGLSISSIATNKTVGPGGVYYVLSRSLGLPMGGAIGYTLFIATSFSIALYLIGFAENFNPVLGMGTTINDFRVSGTLALLLLTGLVYISTSFAIKSQYFILGAIVISIIAIFTGNPELAVNTSLVATPSTDVSFALIFGIFFPAVTGFTAGIAMSGDLENPKRDIPIGTMLAIGAGLIVYLVLAVFLSFSVSESELQNNYNVLMDIALFAPLVVAGIWGATLSSALGGLLGGPRIFQAMSVDHITPYAKIFSNGVGKSNEPRNALILTIIIAEVGVLIGELDSIARLVSMFYLMAYNFINLSFFLESWANSDFSPKFKVSKWVGAIGFFATFIVMFQIDPIAMLLAYLVLFGTYFFLKRKEMSLNSGDIWGSVWSSVVKVGLKRMDGMEENQHYWRPNILLFSGGTEKRPHLIEVSQDLGGRSGMISNFDLIETKEAKVLFPKKDKGVKTSDIREDGIFTRRQEVQDIYDGIETIASIYGFSGIEPNTILMGWPRNSSNPLKFADLTQSLIDLDYNVLYMDYDEKRGYGKYETIDLWWRGISNNVILTIRLVKFILSSQRWSNAKVRVLLVNDNDTDRIQILSSIRKLLSDFRLQAEIKIINNATENLSFFELMKHYSGLTDLVFVGVPEKIYDPENYVSKTNNLVDSIGTTLMVRASSQFSEISLGFEIQKEEKLVEVDYHEMEPLALPFDTQLNRDFEVLEHRLGMANKKFTDNAVSVISGTYIKVFEEYHDVFETFFIEIENKRSSQNFRKQYELLSGKISKVLEEISAVEAKNMAALLDLEIENWVNGRDAVFSKSPERVKRYLNSKDIESKKNDPWDIRILKTEKRIAQKLLGKSYIWVDWRDMLAFYGATTSLNVIRTTLYDLGLVEALNLKALREETVVVIERLLSSILKEPEKRTVLINEAKKKVLEGLKSQIDSISLKPSQILSSVNFRDREMILKMADLVGHIDVNWIIEDLEDDLNLKASRQLRNEVLGYADFWERNKLLFGNLYGAWVITTGLHVELVFLKEKVSRDIRLEVFGMFKRVSKYLSSVYDEQVDTSEDSRVFQSNENELFNHNPSEFLNRVKEELRANIAALPDKIKLIQEDSLLNFKDFQDEEVEHVTIDLQKIADYYIELDFIEPLNRSITRSYNNITNKFEDIGTLIAYLSDLAEPVGEEPQKQHDELTTKLKADFIELNKVIADTEVEFTKMLDKQFSELTTKLSVSELLTSNTNLSRFIHIKQGYKGVFEKLRGVKTKVESIISNSVFELRRKQHQLKMAEFSEKNKSLQNKRNLFKVYVENHSLKPEINQQLPSYYKHLFSGKQVFNSQLSLERTADLTHGVSSISENQGGAILVVSEPMAGKAHYVESLIQKISPIRLIRIAPPSRGVSSTSSLLLAFQKATEQDGSFFNIMSSIPDGTVFTFNNLELWWTRQKEGGRFIDQLVWLIERYGDKHHFILTMNIFSYDLIRELTNIDLVLSATIILPPVEPRALAALMVERQELSSVGIRYSDNLNQQLTKKETQKLFEKYAEGTHGNIGVAMSRWLSSIERLEENTVIVKRYGDYKLPGVFPVSWAVLLTHLVLHGRLHVNNIIELFNLQDKSTINNVIKELLYTRIITEVTKGTYVISHFVIKEVIEQLKDQNYLKNYE